MLFLFPYLLRLSPHALPELLVLVLVHLLLPLLLHAVRPEGSRVFFFHPGIIAATKPAFRNGSWEEAKGETGKDHGGGIIEGLSVTLLGRVASESEDGVLVLVLGLRWVEGSDESEGW